jgi:hypothetical protein
MHVGLVVSSALTIALSLLVARPLIDFFWPLFVAVLVIFFIAEHGTASYLAYLFWHRRCYPAA